MSRRGPVGYSMELPTGGSRQAGLPVSLPRVGHDGQFPAMTIAIAPYVSGKSMP